MESEVRTNGGNKRKRSYFDAFFEERKDKFKSNSNNKKKINKKYCDMPSIDIEDDENDEDNNNINKKYEPPRKRARISNQHYNKFAKVCH